ncbi:MAG: Rha family transcriptional regulator [Staphylococcus pseudoxylosus]|uniref:Rha family transcriptional regulator n=1 Tax=Staphylococcus pseudoxylosus TaxID=2282419 RepID=UPI0031F681B4
MQNLLTIKIENDSELGPVVSSRTIAEELEKRHDNVKRDLEQILISSNVSTLIIPSQYKDSRGRTQNEYLLTKDGFTLYMFNIQGHNDFKMAYINMFNEMEKQLEQQYQVPTNSMEALEMMFQATKETKTEVANIKSDVIDLRENQRLDPGEYNHLSSAISKRVNFIKNQYALTSNRKVTSELYKDINSEVKKMTGVQTRSQLKQKHFDDVIDMINNWYPSQSTVYVIRQLQMPIEEEL